jgi:hypothetical protein
MEKRDSAHYLPSEDPEYTNFRLERLSKFRPNVPQADPHAIAKHQATVEKAIRKYCYPQQIDDIMNGYTRHEVTPEVVLSSFELGDLPDHEPPRDMHYNRALEYTANYFRPPQKVRPVHILDVQHHYPMKNKPNAEPPFSTEKYFVDKIEPGLKASVGNMKPIIFDFTRRWHHEIKNREEPPHRYFYEMLLHIKTALTVSTSHPKTRTIFGVPKPWIIAQIMFFWPLFAHYKSHKGASPLLWGYETFNGGWMRLNYELMHQYIRTSILMIDWKNFDKYALFSVVKDIFPIQRSFLDFSRGYVPTNDYPNTHIDWDPVKEQRLERLWQWTIDAFYETPVLLPDGRVFSRRFRGIPSGLYTTQFLDSMYNCVMLITVLSSLEIPLSPEMLIKLMGDDSIIRLLVCIPPNQHSDFLAKMNVKADEYFKSVISIDKSKLTNRPNGAEVLSYTNHNGLPHRDPTALLAQFYHTKARKPTPGKTMAQAVGMAYASCGFDKQVYLVCKDVYSYYLSQGVDPDPTGLSLALGEDPFGFNASGISLDHFPSLPEIQANLTALDYVSDSVSKFWPESHFLEPY